MEAIQLSPSVLVAVVTGIVAVAGAFMVRRNQTTAIDVNDLVAQIAEARKEAELARAEAAAARAEAAYQRAELARLASLEEKMADGIDDRDQRIADLEDEVAQLRAEVARWRDWVQLQGYDPTVVAEQLADGTAFEE